MELYVAWAVQPFFEELSRMGAEGRATSASVVQNATSSWVQEKSAESAATTNALK